MNQIRILHDSFNLLTTTQSALLLELHMSLSLGTELIYVLL